MIEILEFVKGIVVGMAPAAAVFSAGKYLTRKERAPSKLLAAENEKGKSWWLDVPSGIRYIAKDYAEGKISYVDYLWRVDRHMEEFHKLNPAADPYETSFVISLLDSGERRWNWETGELVSVWPPDRGYYSEPGYSSHLAPLPPRLRHEEVRRRVEQVNQEFNKRYPSKYYWHGEYHY